jgi:hypothetical protein
MKRFIGSWFLLVPCLLAAAPALADDDDDDHRPIRLDNNGTVFLGEIISIRGNRFVPPFGKLPLPANTSRVIFLGAGQEIIVPAGIPVVNLNQMQIGATMFGSGTARRDGTVVADQITFRPAGSGGFFAGRILHISTPALPQPRGTLALPAGTSSIFTMGNGERVIVVGGVPTKDLKRMGVGAIISGEGVPRIDGSIIATRVRFE